MPGPVEFPDAAPHLPAAGKKIRGRRRCGHWIATADGLLKRLRGQHAREILHALLGSARRRNALRRRGTHWFVRYFLQAAEGRVSDFSNPTRAPEVRGGIALDLSQSSPPSSCRPSPRLVRSQRGAVPGCRAPWSRDR